jgi:prolyl-tRNA editing enzyme YbaK/EbsC (Cys-tRNA(Pro) deacylase)
MDDQPTEHPNVTAVVAAARAAGLDVTVAEFPEGTRTAADAAAAVGSDVSAIVKSLVFRVVGGPEGDRVVLALVGGADRLDEGRLAAAAGAERAERVDASVVREATGYAIGGVPPLGHPSPLPTWVDDNLLVPEQVWAAAGTPRHVFVVAPVDLVAATGATVTVLREGV